MLLLNTHLSASLEHVAITVVIVTGCAGLGVHVRYVVRHVVPRVRRPKNKFENANVTERISETTILEFRAVVCPGRRVLHYPHG